MVPDTPDVEAVLLGPSGACSQAKPGTLFIDMSTIAPAAVRKIHAAVTAKGYRMLDAPVSGGDVGAKAGTLSIMVGRQRRRTSSAHGPSSRRWGRR